ncbi:uncharacterized protein LOC121529869 [Drosophila eugracilis]|uniref:uncharacterized protein LOC121529869 n=1 Tax=Drosophila eugracilis TaxID=29029 RepID=UPI001BD9E51E|nr:uncharacterized protein LOC121529869 [Drosophila eugracilis]
MRSHEMVNCKPESPAQIYSDWRDQRDWEARLRIKHRRLFMLLFYATRLAFLFRCWLSNVKGNSQGISFGRRHFFYSHSFIVQCRLHIHPGGAPELDRRELPQLQLRPPRPHQPAVRRMCRAYRAVSCSGHGLQSNRD